MKIRPSMYRCARIPFVFHWFKIVGNFLLLRTGKITKWRNTRDWKDTERYPPKNKKTKAKQQFPQQQETPKTLQNVHWPQIKPVTIRRVKKKKFARYFIPSQRGGNSNSRPSYASGEFFIAYLWRNSWKGILLGKPFRQIRIPSRTPLHLSWCKTRLDSITPAFLCSLGTMQRTKWGQVLYRVSISRVSCSLMKIWTQLGCKNRTCISTIRTPGGTCAFELRAHKSCGALP